ncbi:MAG: flagellar basal-body MS-ring/collar protein FliF [Oscillospiraceae bacterium]
MNEKIKGVFTKVKEKWIDFSRATKVLIISIPIALIAIIIVLAVLLNHKDTVVLYSGLSTSEASAIAGVCSTMGIENVTYNSAGEVIVPQEQADYLRMQLALQGYPSDATTTYEIWNTGVDLWSTDADKRMVAKQQLEQRLGATLTQINGVQSATVLLTIPDKKDYVIVSDKEPASASIQLRLAADKNLSNSEVRAIYRLVLHAVEGLQLENISLTDQNANLYYWVSEEDDKTDEDKSGTIVGRKRLEFQREFQEVLIEALDDFLTKVYGKNGYAINVTALLNFDDKKVTAEEFFPDGDTHEGVINHQQHVTEAIGEDINGGVVGVYGNADVSPDYPTFNGLEEGDAYYYNKDEIQYSVTNIVTETLKDGFSIDRISVALMVNEASMTQTERENLEKIVAMAAGTDVSNVAVYNTSFALGGAGGTTVNAGDSHLIITPGVDSYRDLLLYVVIALGALLIILLILSLLMSKSRKKKIRRKLETAAANAAAGGVGGVSAQGAVQGSESATPEEVDFNIASLTEEAGKDSRETILKREISDFAKTNPEILAQIIKNMLRDD